MKYESYKVCAPVSSSGVENVREVASLIFTSESGCLL
ncbi:MAG: hypothetical protein JWO09_123 [Bacteroidetes bacterium]|nr:hypothetical protein [Bacteroidota bacterium]